MDGTNSFITTYAVKKGNVGAEGDVSVPFSVTNITNWSAEANTILINGDDKQHFWQYAEEGVAAEVPAHAGAGKPGFATEMLKALPEDDDSVLDGASSQGMAEDA